MHPINQTVSHSNDVMAAPSARSALISYLELLQSTSQAQRNRSNVLADIPGISTQHNTVGPALSTSDNDSSQRYDFVAINTMIVSQTQYSSDRLCLQQSNKHSTWELPSHRASQVKQQHQKLFVFLRELLHLMKQCGEDTLCGYAKAIIADCTQQNRIGNPLYQPLVSAIIRRLKYAPKVNIYWEATIIRCRTRSENRLIIK
jgi:hypothetical protein